MDNKMILSILKLRKRLYEFYQNNNRTIQILIKGVGTLFLFLTINSIYHNKETIMIVAAVVLAFVCAVIPSKYIYGLSVLFTTAHVWWISWDLALCYVAVVVLSWILVCRIRPETGIIIAVTPLLFAIKMPFLAPLVVGMFYSLFGVGAIAFGALFYYFSAHSVNAAVLLSSATASKDVLGIQSVMASFAGDKSFLLILVALIVAAVVTYIIYHRSRDYSWYIGCVAGGISGLVIYLGGGIVFDLTMDMMFLITAPAAIGICCVMQFMRCIIDYSGVEYAEFEDDDYYYYVKAVPKVNVIVEDFALIDAAKEVSRAEETVKTEETVMTEEE